MTQIKEKDKTMPKSYEELISKYPLKPIKSKEENDYFLGVYEKLSDVYIENPSFEYIGDYLEALSMFIEKFEDIAYPIPQSSGVDLLKFLMKQHELKQKDLVDIFKTKSILSEILSGNRNFTIEHIKKLSERFNVSADCFIQ
jgi:HTH-type transcriptional regulator/antitoxin HigA